MLHFAFFASLAATFSVLMFGVVCFFKGGDFNEKYGNAAMRWRVMLQGLTLLLFYFVTKNG